MTVVDTSGVVDVLLAEDAAKEVGDLLAAEGSLAAPDVLVFETLAVLRRHVLRGIVRPERAAGAVQDLGDLSIELFPALPLRARAWELRDNMTVADALFITLAEALEEPFATKDGALAGAARRHARIDTVELGRDR